MKKFGVFLILSLYLIESFIDYEWLYFYLVGKRRLLLFFIGISCYISYLIEFFLISIMIFFFR